MIEKTKRLVVLVILLSLLLSGILTFVKLQMTPAWFDGTLDANHALLLNFAYTNNEQSRLLQFLIPEFFHKLFGLSVINSYILQRFLFTAIMFVAFYYYSRKWFSNTYAIVGLLLFTVSIPLTFHNHLQESAALMSLTFLGGLWAIREQKAFLFMLVLVIGSLNNETMLFMPAVYFFVNISNFTWKSIYRLGLKTIFLAFPAYFVVGIIRYITRDAEHLGGAFHLYENLFLLHYPFVVFHIMWFLAFMYFKKKPLFLRRSLLTIPLFILPHMITGIIAEARQMLPLAFIIIPASLFSYFELKKLWLKKSD